MSAKRVVVHKCMTTQTRGAEMLAPLWWLFFICSCRARFGGARCVRLGEEQLTTVRAAGVPTSKEPPLPPPSSALTGKHGALALADISGRPIDEKTRAS